ncbi:MAG: DUF2628 domain-containing protein, partial [Alphaproteobacteria bacterium]|nr:DUF2628 domain-containing protein [Alphaproteobacteria bacterium]
MPVYTVHRRPVPPGREPDLKLVKEGLSWPGLFCPVLWLPYLGDWLGLVTYLALVGTLIVLGFFFLEPAIAAAALLIGLLFLAALANDWRRWRLDRHGYALAGVVAAPDLASAERRWFARPGAEAGPADRDRRVPLWP